MESVLNWIKDNTSYEAVVVDRVIDHTLIKRDRRIGYAPNRFSVNLLKDVPIRSGVYTFFDRDEKLIYVGKTSSLRNRIREHIQGSTHTKNIKTSFHRVAYIRCLEYDARILERELIKEFQPYGNIRGVTV